MHCILAILVFIPLTIYDILKGVLMYFVPDRFFRKDIKGELVLITGGGNGIGQLMAVKMARMGARIVIWDIQQEGMDETCRMIREVGGEVNAYICDVSDRKAIYAMAKVVKTELGIVSILINNAGIVNGKKFLDSNDEGIERVLAINTLAPMWTTKAFLPDMISQDHGHLVFVSSIASLFGVAYLSDYCASKGALSLFEESLRLEMKLLKVKGIKSTIVCPFFISTGLFEGVRSKLIRILKPKDVAETIVNAVLCEKTVVLIQSFWTLVNALKWVVPMDCFYRFNKLLGAEEMMSQFVGAAEARKQQNAIDINIIKDKV